ncbi:YdiU family protein [Lysobacter pythonis]|uniref:Protein nucleotidyltransferase YdiU n=1 Tax=Solilutibacter pythonis TaxID=2483112 RepID=A0A3M2HT81_9GAMM|nr:YdiU family protein [Lysobacter pythonis]RMH90880.1 YdiU family protein [Lysobacter pythonis]
MDIRFDNRLPRALPRDPDDDDRPRQVEGAVWSAVRPTPVAAPRVVAVSADMLATLGLTMADAASPEFAQVFAGNALLPGMRPHATNYGGHQFGGWAGQLGDGRAITLGEAVAPDGRHWEWQLKGAGPTPYSRHADGRAVLRSSIREFLCSEAMHHLGIPTTRALSLVATGEPVLRDMFYDGHPRPEPGAVVCRVAPSFLRFGHFELPASRGDVGLLRQLADFCIERDYPHLAGLADVPRYAAWFHGIAEHTARLVAEWMRVGFVHGVMNTDNMSVLGLTIDYGPYGWIDDYDPDFTPNTTDAHGRRYRFGWQPRIALWNLQQLAVALSPLLADAAPLHAGLSAYGQAFARIDALNIARKLGLAECDRPAMALMRDLQAWMHKTEVDMTIFFRALGDTEAGALTPAHFSAAFYDEAKRDASADALTAWLVRYRQRVADDPLGADARHAIMRRANPRYIPRNWLTQRAIERAEGGDESGIAELLEVMRHPYDEQPGREALAGKRPEWARHKAGCSMLSCSS